MRAQRLISDALDRLKVDAEELSVAKAHCRECDDCAAFVRSLLAVQQSGLPEPPPDLTDRVMARVRVEAAKNTSGRAVPDRDAEKPAASAAGKTAPARSWADLYDRARDPRNRRAVATWAAAAAIVFVAAGIGAMAGVRTILVPQQASLSDGSFEAGSAAMDSAAPEASLPPATEDAVQSESGETQKTRAQAPDLITVDATVYKLTGPAPDVDTGTLSAVGSARTTLGGESITRDYEVMGTDDRATVYIEDGDSLLAFQRITRSYGGRLYVLQSSPIESFGAWPTLPPGFRTPTSDDGSPVFEQIGTDDNGTSVYASVGTSEEDGIAIGPNPPFPDPMAGAPEWTWWKIAP